MDKYNVAAHLESPDYVVSASEMLRSQSQKPTEPTQ